MTAPTPPTPPAIRERKLESVCFEASTTSFLTSPADGIEGADDDDEDEDIACGKKEREKKANRKKVDGSFFTVWNWPTAEAHERHQCQASFPPGIAFPFPPQSSQSTELR